MRKKINYLEFVNALRIIKEFEDDCLQYLNDIDKKEFTIPPNKWDLKYDENTVVATTEGSEVTFPVRKVARDKLKEALQAATDEVNSWKPWKKDLWKNGDKGFTS